MTPICKAGEHDRCAGWHTAKEPYGPCRCRCHRSQSQRQQDYDGPFHTWFGLSYSSYLVVPRRVLQSMPAEWQRQMIALLDQVRETLDVDDAPGAYWVRAREGNRFVPDPYREYRRAPLVPLRKARAA